VSNPALPPKQRAVLIMRGVIGLSAKDAASLLDSSIASVNSALQRARRGRRDSLPEQRLDWARESR
jgi:RNA polymerase sigma-70 factor, ECF subfamily